MIKYATLINEESGLCEVGLDTNEAFYKKIGMTKMDVTKSEIDNQWYLTKKLETENYKQKKVQFEKEKRKNEIQIEMNEIDRKRIRAMCEPELKDAKAGTTWLEYYNTQIKSLRDELTQLST